MKTHCTCPVGLLALFAICHLPSAIGQGPLTPPGAPAPTMKTLAQIEPRKPISALPFTITTSGSYYLTSDLVQTGTAAGIIISADDVTLDLSGFALIGGLSGTAAGVSAPAARKNLQVRNGVIRTWNGGGIAAVLTTNSVFRDLRLAGNNDNGLVAASGNVVSDCVVANNIVGLNVGGGSTLTGCVVTDNLADGISAGEGSTIKGCTARGNNGNGILTAIGCTVVTCTATGNVAGDGIRVGERCTVADCTASSNSGSGIVVGGNYSTIENCTAASNQSVGIFNGGFEGIAIRNCNASGNTSDGIRVSGYSLVIGNRCHSNGAGAPSGAGIHATNANNQIEGNFVSVNDRGIDVDVGFNLIIKNTARFNGGGSLDYDIVAGNQVGVIVSAPSSGAIPAGPAAGVGTTDPWANFKW